MLILLAATAAGIFFAASICQSAKNISKVLHFIKN